MPARQAAPVRRPPPIKAKPLRGDPYAPKPKPPIVVEHPNVIPASQAPEQAAVDAAMQQVVRDSLPMPKPAAVVRPTVQPTVTQRKRAAAKALLKFLLDTGRFGSKTDRPTQIRNAQRELGVTADGIVGPKTRAAAAKQGVALPSDQTQPM